jgi:hypothetical protein
LYIFYGESLLLARLRPSNQDASAGTVPERQRIVTELGQRWPGVPILIRADSSFAPEEIMAWCEANQVDYLLGLAKNARLLREMQAEMDQARQQWEATGESARVVQDFRYRTLDSWSRDRPVVGKAEHLDKGANPRFVVTSLAIEQIDARQLYEHHYCPRGEMENRIKEQKNDLHADRTSTEKLKSNQLRLWFWSVAYVLMNEWRRVGLKGTELEQAQCGTIRLTLLKIGAQVKQTVRRLVVSLTSAYPYQPLLAHVYRNLMRLEVLRC